MSLFMAVLGLHCCIRAFYREFIQPINEPRLTDEEWQEMLKKNARKGVPDWMKSILVPLNKLPEADEEVFYSSGC